MTSRLVTGAGQALRIRRALWAAAGLGLLLVAVESVRAERPSAMKLFPEDTYLFVRMRDAKEFGQRLRDSSTGRMLRDPQVQPFVEDVYGKAGELYAEKAEAILGISWADLQKLPQGEVAFGIVGRPNQKPAFLLLVDQGEQGSSAQKLLERALDVAAEKGGEFASEKIGDVEVTVVRDSEHADRMFGAFERENTIVVATDAGVLRSVLWHWDNTAGEVPSAGSDDEITSAPPSFDASADPSDPDSESEFTPGRTLADNANFTTILRSCRRPQDPPPHAILFVDPIGLFREFSRDVPGNQVALGFLPMLGLDGVRGLGGALTFAVGGYDDLAHYHILLENPRSGLLQLVTFDSGDTTPEDFVPLAVENYITGRWKADVFYDRLREMIDTLLGKDTFDKQFASKVSNDFGLDFREEIVGNLAGRVTLVSAYEKPAHFRSQKHILSVELIDESKAAETLKKVLDKFPDQFEERHFGSVTYYAITPEWWRKMAEEERPFNAFVALMDGRFFIGGSCQLFEELIAARDGTIRRLVDSDDYARVAAALGQESAGTTPALMIVQRPEESIRHLYELLTSEKTRQLIEEHAEENPVLAALGQSLKEHQLPAFDTLVQYYGPGGAILYDTDSGYHMFGFTLRTESAP